MDLLPVPADHVHGAGEILDGDHPVGGGLDSLVHGLSGHGCCGQKNTGQAHDTAPRESTVASVAANQ